MTRRDRVSTQALLMLVLAWAALTQAADGGEAAANSASPAVVTGVGTVRDVATEVFATAQASACDNNWDCGSPLACDPFTECDIDLYACVINQKTGQGECVFQGTCDTCQPFPGGAR